MSSMRLMPQEDDTDDGVEVTWEDQQRINTFSKLNSRLRSIEEKSSLLKEEKEALDDISTELELADEDEPVLYKIGEAFMHIPHARALKRLEQDQSSLDARMEAFTTRASECEKEMAELKKLLYAKFGKAINLDE